MASVDTAKVSKSKSAPAKKKSPPTHPSFSEMITDAIVSLKERTGSSQIAIQKFIEEKYSKTLPPTFKKLILNSLKRLVASENLVKVKNSFKLSPARSSAAKATDSKPKATAKPRPAAAKPKAKAKPAAAKPKPKTKAVAKLKPVAKSKPAAVKPKDKAAPKRKVAKSTPSKAKKVVPVKKPKSVKKSPAKKKARK